jgi:hypothetical protein
MGLLDLFRQDRQPKADIMPRSASGRGHTEGFLEYEELNPELIAQLGLRTFDRMYRTDGDVRQAVALIGNPITAGTWVVEPYGGPDADQNAIDDAEFIKWALFDIMNPNLLGHLDELMPVLLRSGFAPFEELWTTAKWDKDGKEYLILRKLDLRLPRTIWRWFQDGYGELYSIVQQLPVPRSALVVSAPRDPQPGRASNGEQLGPNEVEIRAAGLAYYRIGREGDNWEGVSMLRPAYKHWLMKDAIERIDAIAQEREAVGIPICYPPMSATPRQLDEMEVVLADMRTNDQGFIIAPGPKAGVGSQDGTGWLIEVIGYDRTGTGRDPMPSLQYHTQKIYASVIAEFMRLGHHESGARATAEIQADPFLQGIEALSRGIESVLQNLVDKLIAFNRPKAKNSPKISLSKIDATSLTQLADYVMKLSQAGALLPDKRLEDYLRARADLPTMDPEAVKARGKGAKADSDLRKEVLTGGGQFGDAPGGNKPGGGAGKATPSSANKTKPSKTSLAEAYTDADGRRMRYRPYRPQENIVNLDAIEDYLDGVPDSMMNACKDHILAQAKGTKSRTALKSAIYEELCDVYDMGRTDASDEVATLTGDESMQLGSFRDRGRASMRELANHGATHITERMHNAAEASRLNNGDEATVEIQGAAEDEGFRALRAVALGHGSSAYQQGRHDFLLDAASDRPKLGLLYTAMLDNRVCSACRHADDGVVRDPADPIRLDNRPPNRHCLSNLSGHNYCRCIEIPTLMD